MKHHNVLKIWVLIGATVLPLLLATAAPGEDSRVSSEKTLSLKQLLANTPIAENAPAPDVDRVASAIVQSNKELGLCDTHLVSARRYQDAMKTTLASIPSDRPGNSALISRLDKAALSTRNELQASKKLLASVSKRLAKTSALPSLRGSGMATDLTQNRVVADRALTLIGSALEKNVNITRLTAETRDTLSSAAHKSLDLDLDTMITTTRDSIGQITDIKKSWAKIISPSPNFKDAKAQVLYLYTCGGHWGTIFGNDGDNHIIGTNGPDVILGRGGNDTIEGDENASGPNTGSDDIICGGAGNDHIHGGPGSDTIYGGPGDDFIMGEYAGNVLYGGDGNDYLAIGQVIYGGSGNDEIHGPDSTAVDCFYSGEDGDDVIIGKQGNDTIYGGHGSDRLYGGGGNDTIYGGPSDGNAGSHGSYPVITFSDETFCGGADWDYLYGQDGDDLIYGNGGHDFIEGGEGNDIIYAGYKGFIPINYPDGRDCAWGQGGNDTIYGKAGDDYIDGGDGNDTLYGEAGNDFITGMGNNDIIYGGAGNDQLYGDGWCSGDLPSQPGADMLYGDSGDDSLNGGPLSDSCYGGTGNDSTDGTCETITSIP